MPDSIEVIIIEDNELLRDSLKEAISKSGQISCKHSFASGEAALDFIEKEEIVPDIILLDIGLPGLNGIDDGVASENEVVFYQHVVYLYSNMKIYTLSVQSHTNIPKVFHIMKREAYLYHL